MVVLQTDLGRRSASAEALNELAIRLGRSESWLHSQPSRQCTQAWHLQIRVYPKPHTRQSLCDESTHVSLGKSPEDKVVLL